MVCMRLRRSAESPTSSGLACGREAAPAGSSKKERIAMRRSMVSLYIAGAHRRKCARKPLWHNRAHMGRLLGNRAYDVAVEGAGGFGAGVAAGLGAAGRAGGVTGQHGAGQATTA